MPISDLLGKRWNLAVQQQGAGQGGWRLLRANEDGSRSLGDESGAIELLVDAAGRLDTIFLQPGSAAVTELGIAASFKRGDVLAKFGEPSTGGGGTVHPILGRYGGWDRWDAAERNMHVEYAPDSDTVVMVTLMVPPS